MSTEQKPKQRSRTGCWTHCQFPVLLLTPPPCKRRRRKCDETKPPPCRTCVEGGHLCEGYDARLRWDVGVASRGHLTGAQEPTAASAPPRAKGRQRDIQKANKDHLGHSLVIRQYAAEVTPPSSVARTDSEVSSNFGESSSALEMPPSPDTRRRMQKEALFQEFLTTGSLLLYSTSINESPLASLLPDLCRRSNTLYDVCVACQAYLSHGATPTFFDFYSEALSQYRANLDHALVSADEAIVNAALLLCTIGILQGVPWTIHLHAIAKMLDGRAAMSPLDKVEPGFIFSIEVMGVMDLPCFCIGRQSPGLSAWRRYREGKLVTCEQNPDTIQPISGLPFSFIDMLAYDEDDLTEEELLLWPGCQGSYLQCQLWEAYRFATMLMVRRRTHHRPATRIADRSIGISLPPDALLLTRGLSAIDACFNGHTNPENADSLVLNAMFFPLYQISLEVMCSPDQDGRHDRIKRWWDHLIGMDPFANTRQAWEIIQEVASQREQGNDVTPDHIARSMGIELALY